MCVCVTPKVSGEHRISRRLPCHTLRDSHDGLGKGRHDFEVATVRSMPDVRVSDLRTEILNLSAVNSAVGHGKMGIRRTLKLVFPGQRQGNNYGGKEYYGGMGTMKEMGTTAVRRTTTVGGTTEV